MSFLIDYHKNLCFIHAFVIVAITKNPYKTVITALSYFFIIKNNYKIFTSNLVILYLLNLAVARSPKVIGSPIITMSGKLELNTQASRVIKNTAMRRNYQILSLRPRVPGLLFHLCQLITTVNKKYLCFNH